MCRCDSDRGLYFSLCATDVTSLFLALRNRRDRRTGFGADVETRRREDWSQSRWSWDESCFPSRDGDVGVGVADEASEGQPGLVKMTSMKAD
jgi:hypothetical protein